MHQTFYYKDIFNRRGLTITNGSRTNDFTFLVASKSNDTSSFWNICLSPVMCREYPLSRYHDWCLNGAVKDICKINNFVLRYPPSGSFLVSLLLPRSSWNFGCLGRRILKWYLGMRSSPKGLVPLLGLSSATLRKSWFGTSDMCARRNKFLIQRFWLLIQILMIFIRL